MAEGLVTIGDLFELAAVSSDWSDGADWSDDGDDRDDTLSPSALGCLIVGMDFTARHPGRWRTLRARYLLPDLSLEELAEVLEITDRTVRNHLKPANLGAVVVELGLGGPVGRGGQSVEDLLWQGRAVTLDLLMDCLERDRDGIYELSTPTARYFLLALDFAAREPKRWKTIRCRYFLPDLGQQELAVILDVSQQTVSLHLQPVRLAEVDEFFNKDLCEEVVSSK